MSARVLVKLVWTFVLVITILVAARTTEEFVYLAF